MSYGLIRWALGLAAGISIGMAVAPLLAGEQHGVTWAAQGLVFYFADVLYCHYARPG